MLGHLKQIHNSKTNIVIFDRDLSVWQTEIEDLLSRNIEFQAQGTKKHILNLLSETFGSNQLENIRNDVDHLITVYGQLAETDHFDFVLSAIESNMCKRFHTDYNKLRLLCTYAGQGTLWLKNQDVNRDALHSGADNSSIVKNSDDIQQANTGSVLILKGAMYPEIGVEAIVHRSPTLIHQDEKRLLLRIDTKQTLKY